MMETMYIPCVVKEKMICVHGEYPQDTALHNGWYVVDKIDKEFAYRSMYIWDDMEFYIFPNKGFRVVNVDLVNDTLLAVYKEDFNFWLIRTTNEEEFEKIMKRLSEELAIVNG
jgi:hypothetical protein